MVAETAKIPTRTETQHPPVTLISRPANSPSGLTRYAETLSRHLRKTGLPVRETRPTIPPYMQWLTRAGRPLGYDLQTFLENYPIASLPAPGSLYHLTSENLASLLAFQGLAPSVVTVHGFFTYFLRSQPGLRLYRHRFHQLFDLLAVRGLRQANHLICVSQYIQRMLADHTGIAANRTTVVYEAVDHSTFYPAPVANSFYERYGLSPAYRYILYVGSEQPRKNFLGLLRAFARLRARRSDVRLLKVGSPEFAAERQKAVHLIAELGIEDSVMFMGHVAGELPNFYRIADLFVFPSFYEGFGFPPLEAMACGTPVICSNRTSIPEVVGRAALLFRPEDTHHMAELMEQVLDDNNLREDLRQRGLARAGLFTWQKTSLETLQVYRKVLERGA